ncbi:membrane protein [gamma proteobacterium HTCC5015]|nr:membrane protein [gamma proteobacterium HTCC5015]
MSASTIFAFLLTGVFSGTVAGLLGVGGGLIIVPIIVAILHAQGLAVDYAIKIAVATSLAIIIPTSLSSARAHHRSGALRWPLFWQLLPGIIAGTVLGGFIVDAMPELWLRLFFSVGCWAVGLKMLLGAQPKPHRQLPASLGMSVAGSIIGAISAMLGIGGGSLTVPFLHWCNVNMREAVATSSACGLPIAVAGAITLALTGLDLEALPQYSLGYIYLPAFLGIATTAILMAPVGAKLAHRLPIPVLKKCLALFLLVAGTRMLGKATGWF